MYYIVPFIVKNNGTQKVKKVVYYYKVKVKVPVVKTEPVISPDAIITTPDAITVPAEDTKEQEYKSVSFRVQAVAKQLMPGEASQRISLKIPMDPENDRLEEVKLYKVELYSGNACIIRNYRKNRKRVVWGKEDVKAPEISGLVKKNSRSNNAISKEIYMQVYADQLDEYSFKKYIQVKDNRAGKIKVQLDFSEVDLKKEGIYKVKIRAKDRAGNVAKAYTWISLMLPGSAEQIADDILGKITKESDSDVTKVRAIYRYVKTNFRYAESAERGSWREAGLNAARYRSGDCYSYYAFVRLLCVRAKIPCIRVGREGTGYHHWWDLVCVNGMWYHVDATPRLNGGEFCLMTDSQLDGYRREGSSPFIHTKSCYPKVAQTKISPDP